MSFGFKADPSGLYGTVTIDGVDSLVINKDGSIVGNNFVDSNGQLLSAGATNHIIDGDFNFWHEGTSQTDNGYGSDTMYYNGSIGSTKVHERALFTIGQTLVPGGLKYYSSTIVTSVTGAGNLCYKQQKIEAVRKLAGKTATLSFFAKADSTKDVAFDILQFFGTGGSPSANVDSIGKVTFQLGTDWTKFTTTIEIPSISGKTIGTDNNDATYINFFFDAGTDFDSRTDSLGHQSGTFDIARVRLVEGEVDGDHIDEDPSGTSTRIIWFFQKFIGVDGCINYYTADYATIGPISYAPMRDKPSITLDAGPTPIAGAAIGDLISTGLELNNVSFAFDVTNATSGFGGRFVSMDFTLDGRL